MSDYKEEVLEKELSNLYIEIGRIFYEEKKNSPDVSSKYENAFIEIKKIVEKYQKQEAEELAKQGLKRCPSCGEKVTLVSRFCNMCGVNLSNVVEVAVEMNSKPIVRKCRTCNTVLEKDSVFCTNCGQRQ